MEVFAVDSTAVQLAWGAEGGRLPGTSLISGLSPAMAYDVRSGGRSIGRVRTLEELPGEEQFRFATVSDCHIGERGFGLIVRQREWGPAEPYPVRCLRAAVQAAVDWGAQAIVVKGDLVQRGRVGECATARDLFRALIGDRGIPVIAVPGNHEAKLAGLTTDTAGFEFDFGVVVRSFPGFTLVTANSSAPDQRRGQVVWEDKVVAAAAAAAPGPVMVAVHHQFQRRLTYWPPGILGADGERITRRMGEANPNVWIVSGHTHRNRTYERNGVLLSEVGSTKDYPGTWAGYVVTDKAIRQTVWKVTGDGTDAWLWRTRRAAGGLWGRWSPGRVEDRCVTRVFRSATRSFDAPSQAVP